MIKKFFILLVFFLPIFFFVPICHADVVEPINPSIEKVFVDPDGLSWIEIVNFSKEEKHVALQITEDKEVALTLPPLERKIITNSITLFEQRYPDIIATSPDKIEYTTFELDPEIGSVILSEEIFCWGETTDDESCFPASVLPDHTIEKNTQEKYFDNPNPIPLEKTTEISGVILSEIYPNPPGSDTDINHEEFIELQNLLNSDISLYNWQVCDLSKCYNLQNILIPKNDFVILRKSICGSGFISLNNTDEKISLFSPLVGQKPIFAEYSEIPEGKSFAYINNEWQWPGIPTPGLPNQIDQKIESDEGVGIGAELQPISEVKKLPLSKEVKIRGKVTALPGSISDQYFYIQDASGGVQVYSYYKRFPELKQGDLVEVIGEISETGGERRVKISTSLDISILERQAPLAAASKSIDQITGSDVGQHVSVRGVVVSSSGSEFYIEENGSKIKVSIKKPDLVKKPRLSKGNKIQVSGVISIYNEQLRILPFEPEGVKILDQSSLGDELPEAGSQLVNYIITYLSTHILWTTFLIMKKRRSCLQKSMPRV